MRASTMRKPAFSKRARMSPITFFLTASGLMMVRVCSTAISLNTPCKFHVLRRHVTPFGQNAGSICPRLIARIHAEPRNPHEVVAAHEERQAGALPRRHARLLEKIFQ